MKHEYAICLDIGGTVLKSGIVDSSGRVTNRADRPVDSSGTKEEILAIFSSAIMDQLAFAKAGEMEIKGVGIAIGGPFDYEKGICLIKGLDKYESLYGCNVKDHLRGVLPLPPGFPITFDADSWSFARGEARYGAGKDFRRGIVFTLGTGVGSAFFINGEVVNEGPGIPWLGWISGQAYRDGILNDYISGVHMRKRFAELAGVSLEPAEIAKRADAGDAAAKAVYLEVGTVLADFIKDRHVREFRAECLVFGGQISKSFPLFSTPFIRLQEEMPFLKAVLPASDIDDISLRGVMSLLLARRG